MLRLIQAELIEYLYVFIVFRHHELNGTIVIIKVILQLRFQVSQ